MILAGVLVETWRVRFPAAGSAVISGGISQICRLAGFPGGDGDRFWGICCIRSKRFQTAGGLFIGQPYGICGAWELPQQPKRPERLNATIALNGAVLQMFNHGLSAAGMFFLVGVIYERTHTRNLDDFGGLFPLVPIYGGILIFTSMASLGLPGLNGFVSEFLVVRGSWPVLTLYTAIAMIGLLFTGAYILKGIKNVLHGPLNEHWAQGEHKLTEINTRGRSLSWLR